MLLSQSQDAVVFACSAFFSLLLQGQYSLAFLQYNVALLHEYGQSIASNFIKSIEICLYLFFFRFLIFSSCLQQSECCYWNESFCIQVYNIKRSCKQRHDSESNLMCGRSCFAGQHCSHSLGSCYVLEVFVLNLCSTKGKR